MDSWPTRGLTEVSAYDALNCISPVNQIKEVAIERSGIIASWAAPIEAKSPVVQSMVSMCSASKTASSPFGRQRHSAAHLSMSKSKLIISTSQSRKLQYSHPATTSLTLLSWIVSFLSFLLQCNTCFLPTTPLS